MSKALILAQRAGYVAGAQAAVKGKWTSAKQLKAIAESEVAFPLTTEQPRVAMFELPERALPPGMRPRFVRFVGERKPYIEYRVVDGQLESRCPVVRQDAPENIKLFASRWRKSYLTPDALKDLSSLYATPTETVAVTE